MTLNDLLGNDDAPWMSDPRRPCASPINDPAYIGEHADTWYPRERHYDRATVLCAGCPVINQCLTYALDNREEDGVWGGTTPKQRRNLLRRQARQAAKRDAA